MGKLKSLAVAWCFMGLFVLAWSLHAQESRPASRPAPLSRWILAGQSNMEGNGYLDGAPADPRVSIFRRRDQGFLWDEGREPSHRAVEPRAIAGWATGPAIAGVLTGRKGASPGTAFGVARAIWTGQPVGLIPCAVGGTSMTQWDPAKRDDPKSLYGNLLTLVKASGGAPAGLIWYQGEADAVGSPEAAAAWSDRFAAWVSALRHDVSAPDLPVIVTQLSRYVIDKDPTGWNTVREAQRLISTKIPRCQMVAAVDLPLDDPIHLSASALRRLGVRYAKVSASLLGEPDAPSPGPRFQKVALEGTLRDRIVVTFQGVNGGLLPLERVFGFSVHDSNGKELPIIFDAAVDIKARQHVVIRLAASLPQGARLAYGMGLNPICNLVDEEDMAAPAFLPIAIEGA